MDEILFALTLIFVVAALLLLVAAKASLPVIPFYLLSGILVSIAIDETQLLELAQWGVAFLVFLFGIHVDLEALSETGRISAAIALLQAVAVGGVTAGVGLLAGLDLLNATYLGIAAALSSSLVATSYLDGERGVRPTFRRLAESIHFTEDLLGVVAVLGLSAFVYVGTPALQQFAAATGLFVLALAIRYLAFYRLTARLQGDPEVMMLVGVSFVIGFLALAEFAGLSIIVGAFTAGIAIADDYPHSLELVDTIDDLEDFFSPIFFVTVGALLSIPTLETVGYTLVLVVAVLVLNPLLVAALLHRSGFDGRTAIRTGLTLDQISAFSLFIAIEAVLAEAIVRSVFEAIVLAAVVTMVVSSYSARHAEAITRRLRERGLFELEASAPLGDRTHVTDGLTDHVIVVDFEHGGREVLAACRHLERPICVIEDNPLLFDEIRSACENYVYGDVADDRVWELAGLKHAALVVSLAPESDRAQAVVDLGADVPRIVRVDDTETGAAFLEAGADGVIYPAAIAAERVGVDLRDVLEGEISEATFRNRGRAHVELEADDGTD